MTRRHRPTIPNEEPTVEIPLVRARYQQEKVGPWDSFIWRLMMLVVLSPLAIVLAHWISTWTKTATTIIAFFAGAMLWGLVTKLEHNWRWRRKP